MTNQKKSWKSCTLDKVATVKKGRKPERFCIDNRESFPYLEAATIRGQQSPQYISKSNASNLIFSEKKDTLILWDGANAGEIFSGVGGIVASTMACVRVSSRDIIPEFLHFVILSHSNYLRETTSGSTVPHVRSHIVQSLPIPLPPLPVQERIIEILNKVEDIQRKRKEAIDISEEILPAIYRDLFGDPEVNPNNWPIEELGNSIEESNYGTSEKSETFSEGTPVLRIPNVIGRMININNIKFLKVNEKERKRYLLSKGDVLIVRTNGNRNYVGRCAVFDLEDDYLFASYLIRLRIKKSRLDPHYVIAFFSTPYGRKQINMKTRTSAGQYNLSLSSIKEIEIPIPPLSRQEKFLNEYRQWELTKSRLEQSYIEAENTFKSVLKEAFSGRLTAEWEAERSIDKMIGSIDMWEMKGHRRK